MMSNDAVYITNVKFGPDLGLENLEADVLHDQVDMDPENYVIYGKSEIVERNQRGVKYKEISGVKNCIHGVDVLLAETIAILNRKGYKTDACCQGHLPFANDLIYEVDANDKEKLESLLESVKENRSEIIQVKGNIYSAVTGIINCWIRFDEKTEFPYLPEKFSLGRLKMGGMDLCQVFGHNFLDDFFNLFFKTSVFVRYS